LTKDFSFNPVALQKKPSLRPLSRENSRNVGLYQ